MIDDGMDPVKKLFCKFVYTKL